MLKKIVQHNYRAFENVEIDFSKINLFFGPNNSGKSSIISSLNLMAQTLESADISVPLLFSGNRIDLGTYKDTVFKNDYQRLMAFSFTFVGANFSDNACASIDLNYKYRKIRREVILDRVRLSSEDGEIIVTGKPGNGPNRRTKLIVGSQRNEPEIGGIDVDAFMRHFLPQVFPNSTMRKRMSNADFLKVFNVIDISDFIMQEFRRMEYIGPFREYPERTFQFTGENPLSVGKNGEKYVNMLFRDFISQERGKKKLIQKVSKWLNQSRIAKSIEIEILTDRHFEIRLSNSETGEPENIADVGFGCSQIIPILVDGYNQKEGDIFIVEQPELHLHPRAQSELGNFFYDLYKNGVQTIIETHSEHLLLRLQILVAKGLIKPDDINVYYVWGKKGGSKEIKLLKMNEEGYFEDDWPEGFFPEKLEEARKLALAQSEED